MLARSSPLPPRRLRFAIYVASATEAMESQNKSITARTELYGGKKSEEDITTYDIDLRAQRAKCGDDVLALRLCVPGESYKSIRKYVEDGGIIGVSSIGKSIPVSYYCQCTRAT
ncbi:hypothetical protein Trydic_g3757 [Trypoxylus dichotomus]